MTESMVFTSWEEVLISREKGRREVHYYLKRSDGGSDLAVVGKERSPRHMSYVVTGRFLQNLRSCAGLKWRSRREVVDWLSTFVSGFHSQESPSPVDRIVGSKDSKSIDDATSKDFSSRRLKPQSKGFSWIGSSSTCHKKRKHYRSFCRNGIVISVYDFVHVMVEDNKRLIAYLEDMYEDSKANKMVVVRWFHKLDEVGIILPPNSNDREIFFSLSLQDLNVECIDGLATVLNAHHFEKFMNEAAHTTRELYFCHRQFDNDIMPFDITEMKGYWRQGLLRHMYAPSPMKGLSLGSSGGSSDRVCQSNGKRRRLEKRSLVNDQVTCVAKDPHSREAKKNDGISNLPSYGSKVGTVVSNLSAEGRSSPVNSFRLPRKLVIKWNPQQHLSPGSSVEVLSHDSGIRGCWFSCVILKRRSNRLKVRYLNVQNADETGNLEEWIPAARIAAPDRLVIRTRGRPSIRPNPPPRSKAPNIFDAGTSVDAWWHDGWWEGIVTSRYADGKLEVYFPGEQRTSVFCLGDLRHSMEWVHNRWNPIDNRPDIIHSLFLEHGLSKSSVAVDDEILLSPAGVLEHCRNVALAEGASPSSETSGEAPTPLKGNFVLQMSWNSSTKKRRQSRASLRRRARGGGCCGSSGSSQDDEQLPSSPAFNRFVATKSLEVDEDCCKPGGNPLCPVSLSNISNLVVSQ